MRKIKLFEEFISYINKERPSGLINLKGDIWIDRLGVYHIKDWKVY